MRIDGLIDSPFDSEQRFRGLMLAFFVLLRIPIQEQRLMQSFLGLFGVRSFLATVHLLLPGFLFFVGLGLGVLVGRLMAGGFIMLAFFGADQLVLVAEDFLFGFKELKVGRSGGRHPMVVLDFEFRGHLY
jgi:hypothetical protein